MILEAWGTCLPMSCGPSAIAASICRLLSRKEVGRDCAWNRRLFLRLSHAWYQFEPTLSVRRREVTADLDAPTRPSPGGSPAERLPWGTKAARLAEIERIRREIKNRHAREAVSTAAPALETAAGQPFVQSGKLVLAR